MVNKNARIFVASIAKLSKELEHYGTADTDKLSLLKLIYKYSCHSSTYSQLQRLDNMVSNLQRTDKLICLEKQSAGYASYTSPAGSVTIGLDGNIAPTLTSSSITVLDPNDTYTFTYSDLFSGYSDDSVGTIGSFVIDTLPANGTLAYNGFSIVAGTLLYDPTKLVYSRNNDTGSSTSFTYSAYDNDSQLTLVSNVVSCAVTVESITVANQPPTVGNTNIYENNRTTTILTSADFTSLAIAPYIDPEGDALDAIKILAISAVNGGNYYYYGAIAVVGQVITKAELDTGAFYHTAADSNSITTDTIEVAVRDTGSMIWVD